MHDAAALHHENAVGNVEHEAQHLLADDNAEIADTANVAEQPRDILDDRGLNAFGRLIEQQHFRIARQRPRNRQLLLLSARQIAAAAALEILEDRKKIVDLVWNIALTSDNQSGLDVLLHRHGAEDLTALRHIGEAIGDAPVARQRGQVDAIDGDL